VQLELVGLVLMILPSDFGFVELGSALITL